MSFFGCWKTGGEKVQRTKIMRTDATSKPRNTRISDSRLGQGAEYGDSYPKRKRHRSTFKQEVNLWWDRSSVLKSEKENNLTNIQVKVISLNQIVALVIVNNSMAHGQRQQGGHLTIHNEEDFYNHPNKDLELQMEKLSRQLVARNEDVVQLNIELQNCKAERDDFRHRLSQQAAHQLTDNNPTIADLSDPNRPQKLAERFSELYDNEWTDAYEELTEIRGVPDKAAVCYLLQVLQIIYGYCDDRARHQLAELEENIKMFTGMTKLPDNLSLTMRTYREERRKNYMLVLPKIHQKIELTLCENNITVDRGTQLSKFIQACSDICWLMSIQDPPMALEIGQQGDVLNKDRYKAYTKSGKRIMFLVWPVLLQYHGGPLMAKGIAEGKGKKQPFSNHRPLTEKDNYLQKDKPILSEGVNKTSVQPMYDDKQTRHENREIENEKMATLKTVGLTESTSEYKRNIEFVSKDGHHPAQQPWVGERSEQRRMRLGERSKTTYTARPVSDNHLSITIPQPGRHGRHFTINSISDKRNNPYIDAMQNNLEGSVH